MPTATVYRSSWQKIRFSLRDLMILVLVIGSGLGGMIVFVRDIRAQREAVVAIKNAGGRVLYDSTLKDWRPGWFNGLVKGLGVDCVEHPVCVSIDPLRGPLPLVSEAVFGDIEQLPRLEILDVSGAQVHDSWLVHVQGLSNLRVLGLNKTHITDSGLGRIRQLGNLQTIFLVGTQAGLTHQISLGFGPVHSIDSRSSTPPAGGESRYSCPYCSSPP